MFFGLCVCSYVYICEQKLRSRKNRQSYTNRVNLCRFDWSYLLRQRELFPFDDFSTCCVDASLFHIFEFCSSGPIILLEITSVHEVLILGPSSVIVFRCISHGLFHLSRIADLFVMFMDILLVAKTSVGQN